MSADSDKWSIPFDQTFEPLGGVWQIHFHRETGEGLGPSVKMGAPTRCGWARRVDGKWVEISDAEGSEAWGCQPTITQH